MAPARLKKNAQKKSRRFSSETLSFLFRIVVEVNELEVKKKRVENLLHSSNSYWSNSNDSNNNE